VGATAAIVEEGETVETTKCCMAPRRSPLAKGLMLA